MKNLKIAVISDLHEDREALKRYLNYLECSDIPIGFYLGDSVSRNCDDDTNYFWNQALKIKKPVYYTIGNHDVGIDEYKSIESQKLYNIYIYPMLTSGYLDFKNLNSESCYYYKDLDDYKIRFISVFEYEGTRDSEKTIGFEHRRYISSEQLNWFAKTLYETPIDYSVIIMTHQIPSLDPIYQPCSFCANIKKTNLKEDLSDGYGYLQLAINGNPLGDIINAYKTSSSIQKQYEVKEEYKAYLPNPKIDFDFSNRENGKFICFLTGHLHCSLITTSKEYSDQLAITVPSGSTGQFERQNDDIKPLSKMDDNFYVLEIDIINQKVKIKKIGNTKTIYGAARNKIELTYE